MVSEKKRSILLVAGLVGFSSLIQVMVVARAVTPELDSVRFVETAQRIAEQGLVPALQATSDQPLYPVAIWLVHEGFQRVWGDSRLSWVLSAQIAGAIPLVLAVVPVYFLSVRLVGRAPALAGTLLFCVLPEVCSLGANGISDSSHLLFLCLAFWAVAVYITGPDKSGPECMAPQASSPHPPQSPLWLLLVGLAVGMALLTRAEALILPGALILTLGLLQLHPRYRQAWWRPVAATACLALGIAIVLGPYLLAVGATTSRSAVARILGQADPKVDHAATSPQGVAAGRLSNGEPMSFRYKDPSISVRRRGVGAVAKLCSEELADAFGYWVGPFALLGLWWLRRVLRRPIDWFDYLFLGLYGLAATWFASREGYLCARHLLPILVVGIGCGGYGLLETGHWLAQWLTSGQTGTGKLAPLLCSVMPWLAVAIAGAACVVEASKPLNHVFLCHRQAAEWLARQTDTPGEVLDTWGLTGLYSGRKTCLYSKAPTVLGSPHLTYVVLESRELEFDTSRSRTLQTLLTAAEPVASFTTPLTAHGQRTVVVYRWYPERWGKMQNAECRMRNGKP